MLPSWIAITVGLSSFLLGFGMGAYVISVFDSKNVGRLQDEREENSKLRRENRTLRKLVTAVTEEAT